MAGRSLGLSTVKVLPPSDPCKVRQQPGTQPFFGSGKVVIVDSHTVNKHVGLFHQGPDLALSVAAVIVASVGDNQECPLPVSCLADLGNAQVDRIQQSGLPVKL